MIDASTSHSERQFDSVTVIGAGGNIGSHLVPHLGRVSGLGRVTLVDFDRYESKNLASQDIRPGDVGRSKARVQARRLKQINPALQVVAFEERVERVPLGRLRADVLVACVDSRLARQSINQIAWRLGRPWVDAGVAAGGELLARVNVYLPGGENACLECAWSDDDYGLLELRHPCQTEATVTSTNAPSTLGALAASLAVIECRKLLEGENANALIGRQVVVDARHHTHFVTSFRRNPRCRFDHRVWSLERSADSCRSLRLRDLATMPPPLAGAASVGSHRTVETNPNANIPALAASATGRSSASMVAVEGQRFVMRPPCARGCAGESSDGPELVGIAGRLGGGEILCPSCGARLEPGGWDMTTRLPLDVLSRKTRSRTLTTLGFRPGDVVTISDGTTERHIELS